MLHERSIIQSVSWNHKFIFTAIPCTVDQSRNLQSKKSVTDRGE